MKRLAAVSLFVLAGSFGVARGQAPQNQALCQDGTTIPAQTATCADHGGVVSEGTAVTRARAVPSLFEATERKRAGAGTLPLAFCKDGMVTNAGQGACVHNGGIERTSPAPVASTRTVPASYEPKAELKTPAAAPSARCHDGTLSYDGYSVDACTGHGGVAEWLTAHP